MKRPSKYQWVVIIFFIVLFIGFFTGPTKPLDLVKTPEVAKAVSETEEVNNIIEPLSFNFPNENARVVMECQNPITSSGFVWVVESLDDVHPPKVDKIFYNLQKERNSPIQVASWRGIKSSNDNKLPVGDAFMLTVSQSKEDVLKNYKYYVFSVANSLEEVKQTKDVVVIPANVVVMTSSLIMTTHPCSSLNSK